MLYTTYFKKIGKMPNLIVPVAISNSCPEWYTGLRYKELSPPWELVSKLKRFECDQEFFRMSYQASVLRKLNPNHVLAYLKSLTQSDNVALVCWEYPEDFCHRHIVADWFNSNGIQCSELRL